VALPPAYADATALIGLARIDGLNLLGILSSSVRVTTYVWQEVVGDPTKPGTGALLRARADGLLTVVDEGDPDAFPQLDAGESTVLSAAAAAHGVVIADERKARSLVLADPGLRATIRQTTGIIGLILLAKRRGRIAAVRPLLDELLQQGFYISPSLYQEVLGQVGE
jgi:predicted nucleic acid-binding protein